VFLWRRVAAEDFIDQRIPVQDGEKPRHRAVLR